MDSQTFVQSKSPGTDVPATLVACSSADAPDASGDKSR
jgi:hypothetical protein